MPSITLTVTTEQAARIGKALAGTDYPATLEGFKQLLTDYIRQMVLKYERTQAEIAALATVVQPEDLVVE